MKVTGCGGEIQGCEVQMHGAYLLQIIQAVLMKLKDCQIW